MNYYSKLTTEFLSSISIYDVITERCLDIEGCIVGYVNDSYVTDGSLVTIDTNDVAESTPLVSVSPDGRVVLSVKAIANYARANNIELVYSIHLLVEYLLAVGYARGQLFAMNAVREKIALGAGDAGYVPYINSYNHNHACEKAGWFAVLRMLGLTGMKDKLRTNIYEASKNAMQFLVSNYNDEITLICSPEVTEAINSGSINQAFMRDYISARISKGTVADYTCHSVDEIETVHKKLSCLSSTVVFAANWDVCKRIIALNKKKNNLINADLAYIDTSRDICNMPKILPLTLAEKFM